jgi:Na+/melibiose symporter-like transporter
MKAQVFDKLLVSPLANRRTWMLFGFLFVALTASAIFGVQPAHASSCTSTQCSYAYAYAVNFCSNHAGLAYFACPDDITNQTDDFSFWCYEGNLYVRDCAFRWRDS